MLYNVHTGKSRLYQKLRRDKMKTQLVLEMGNQCWNCRQEFPIEVYDFHHIDPALKERRGLNYRSLIYARQEVQKCALLCSNCHRLVHSGKVSTTQLKKD